MTTMPGANLQILAAFADALNRHDLDDAMALMHDDCIYLASAGPDLDGATFRGRDEVRRGFETLIATFPDLRYDDMQIVLDGDRAALGWTMTGTSAQSQEQVTMRGCDLVELADGKIIRKDAFRKARLTMHRG